MLLYEWILGVVGTSGHSLTSGFSTNPHAPSNKNISIRKCYMYRKHEMEKRGVYKQRIREVEHVTFTFGKEATTFYKRPVSSFSEHRDQPFSCGMKWLRCTISFSLLRSVIQCIQGAGGERSSQGHFVKSGSPVDLVTAETDLESS